MPRGCSKACLDPANISGSSKIQLLSSSPQRLPRFSMKWVMKLLQTLLSLLQPLKWHNQCFPFRDFPFPKATVEQRPVLQMGKPRQGAASNMPKVTQWSGGRGELASQAPNSCLITSPYTQGMRKLHYLSQKKKDNWGVSQWFPSLSPSSGKRLINVCAEHVKQHIIARYCYNWSRGCSAGWLRKARPTFSVSAEARGREMPSPVGSWIHGEALACICQESSCLLKPSKSFPCPAGLQLISNVGKSSSRDKVTDGGQVP